MKSLLFTVSVLVSLSGSWALACRNGDTSAVLLVVPETSAGEENAVIGEIKTADGSIKMDRWGYYVSGRQGSLIQVKNELGETLVFDARKAVRTGRFCFAAIYPN